MKNRIINVALLTGLLIWPALAWGQGKVGIFNMQLAIANTQEGKKAFADLQKKYQPRQLDLQRQQQEIQALQEQLQKQQNTLSDEERIRLTRELEDKTKLFKRANEDATSDFQTEQQDTFQRLAQKMFRIVNEYGQQNGFSLILEEGQIQVYYATRENVLTEEIAKRYDAAYPVEAAAAPAAATPAPAAPAPKPTATAPKPR